MIDPHANIPIYIKGTLCSPKSCLGLYISWICALKDVEYSLLLEVCGNSHTLPGNKQFCGPLFSFIQTKQEKSGIINKYLQI